LLYLPRNVYAPYPVKISGDNVAVTNNKLWRAWR